MLKIESSAKAISFTGQGLQWVAENSLFNTPATRMVKESPTLIKAFSKPLPCGKNIKTHTWSRRLFRTPLQATARLIAALFVTTVLAPIGAVYHLLRASLLITKIACNTLFFLKQPQQANKEALRARTYASVHDILGLSSMFLFATLWIHPLAIDFAIRPTAVTAKYLPTAESNGFLLSQNLKEKAGVWVKQSAPCQLQKVPPPPPLPAPILVEVLNKLHPLSPGFMDSKTTQEDFYTDFHEALRRIERGAHCHYWRKWRNTEEFIVASTDIRNTLKSIHRICKTHEEELSRDPNGRLVLQFGKALRIFIYHPMFLKEAQGAVDAASARQNSIADLQLFQKLDLQFKKLEKLRKEFGLPEDDITKVHRATYQKISGEAKKALEHRQQDYEKALEASQNSPIPTAYAKRLQCQAGSSLTHSLITLSGSILNYLFA